MATEAGWRRSDTLAMLVTLLLPLLSGAWVFSGSARNVANFSPLELDWTGWGGVGVLVAAYKVFLLAGDQAVVRRLDHGWRPWLGGLWTLSNAIGFLLTFLLLTIVGWLVGQVPTLSPPPGAEEWATISFVSALLFMGVERVLLVFTVFGLICRYRLGG